MFHMVLWLRWGCLLSTRSRLMCYIIAGCPQSTEKVLGVGILAFSQIRSEKGIPFGLKEEFLSILNGSHLIKAKLAVSRTWKDPVTKIKFLVDERNHIYWTLHTNWTFRFNPHSALKWLMKLRVWNCKILVYLVLRNSYNFGSSGRTFGILFHQKRSDFSILFGMARKEKWKGSCGHPGSGPHR